MTDLDVHMAGDLIVVADPETNFVAIYHEPTREPWLKLKQRTETKDHALLAPSVARCQRQGARVRVNCLRRSPGSGKGLRRITERWLCRAIRWTSGFQQAGASGLF